MSFISKVAISFVCLSACAPLHRDSDSQFATIFHNGSGRVLTQSCNLVNDPSEEKQLRIISEFSEMGHIYRVLRGTSEKSLSVIVTAKGVTAYEFAFNEITGINSAKASMVSIRELYELAKKYEAHNPVAAMIIRNNKERSEPRKLKFQETSIVNIALGFNDRLGILEESFFWQGILPQVLRTSEGKIEIPHEEDIISDLRTPFRQRFFSEMSSEKELLDVEWYEVNYFVKSATWTYQTTDARLKRKLSCSEPRESTEVDLIEEHRNRFARVEKVMAGKIVGSNINTGAEENMLSLTLENFSKISGMSLIDPEDYEWTEDNFALASKQFLQGSLAGLCLRYHNLLETQVRSKLCEDKELKFIFSSPHTKRSFVQNLGVNLKLMIDGYGLSEALAESYENHRKEVNQSYLKFREEICITPIEPIFLNIDSLKCDSI